MRAVNLIPAEQRSGQPVGAGRSQGGAYAVLVLIAGLAIMAYAYGSADHKISSSRTQAASIAAEAQRAQAAAERLAPYTSFIAIREQRTQAVEALMDARFDWAHVLHEFGRVLPSQASITSLSGIVGSATASPAATSSAASSTVASATPPGSIPTFTIAGCATSQSAVALTLERLRLIDGVKEVTLQSSSTSSSGGGTSGVGCPAHDPSFSATVNFAPLPSSAAITAATKTVSDTAAGHTSAGAPAAVVPTSTSGVSAR